MVTIDASLKSGHSRIELDPIGYCRTEFSTLSHCPPVPQRDARASYIELLPEFSAGLHNIRKASHLIVLYWLHAANRSPNLASTGCSDTDRGVFVSRTPSRPNPIGMAVVKRLGEEGTVLTVSGLDCKDGTPLLDIKPYVPQIDCVSEATISWTPPV